MRTRTLLLIEDDLDVANILRTELQDGGYQVIHAADGSSGLALAHEHTPHLIVLDLGLPDLNGQEVLKRLRTFYHSPIVILTAHGTPDERPHLISLGANDYLLKPFRVPELLARLDAQFGPTLSTTQSVGPLELDCSCRSVTYQGRVFVLTQQEFDIAAFLAHQPGRLYSRSEIQRAISASHDQDVDEPLLSLRRKLRQPNGKSLVRAVRDLGFALRA